MKDFLARLTLFDFIGILTPGAMTLGALAILLSVFDAPVSRKLPPRDIPSGATFLLLAYVVGTIVASLATLVLRRRIHPNFGSRPQSAILMNRARAILGVPAAGAADLWRELDAHQVPYPLQQLYVARQGYYRAMTVVAGIYCVVAAVALVAALCGHHAHIGSQCLNAWYLACICLAAIGLVCLFRDRYYYFIQWEMVGALAAL